MVCISSHQEKTSRCFSGGVIPSVDYIEPQWESITCCEEYEQGGASHQQRVANIQRARTGLVWVKIVSNSTLYVLYTHDPIFLSSGPVLCKEYFNLEPSTTSREGPHLSWGRGGKLQSGANIGGHTFSSSLQNRSAYLIIVSYACNGVGVLFSSRRTFFPGRTQKGLL